ncbi:hypothetical protein KGF56_003787 [Candida oxycetoniae]|uniref:Thioredoxin-like fold domain-containing protein n=1 Tax=Candida oxycetoniae TaxID=497107 RepID=A0AAI9SUL7_9ASCO|nr:uncharacterized protein KGF56_003787 [Candida oxycetoniae]KAI3403366.1 hypothetical protein KGF56_003787 [Candida oxycetoniae]
MISPKYSLTHYYFGTKTLLGANHVPHVVNLYFDYNCPFSARLYLKLYNSVIPDLQKKHPGRFQFIYVNVIQPWHVNSVLLNEFSLAYAKLLREKYKGDDDKDEQELFWKFSKVVFENREHFYDTSNIDLTRNEVYEQIYAVVSQNLDLGVEKDKLLSELVIRKSKEPSNEGNGATADVKYFTKYLRNTGIHVTPTVVIDGIVEDTISSGASEHDLVKAFESKL